MSANTHHEPIAEAPDWILRAAHASRERRQAAGDIEPDTHLNVVLFKQALAQRPGAIEGQGGDRWTYETACLGHDRGLTEGTTTECMRQWNREKCIPPWSDDELHLKVINAFEYAQNGWACDAQKAPSVVYADVLAAAGVQDTVETRGTADERLQRLRKEYPLTVHSAAADENLRPLKYRDSRQCFIDNPDGTCAQTHAREKSYKTTITIHKYMRLILETGAHVAYVALEGAYGMRSGDVRAILTHYKAEIDAVRGELTPREWFDQHYRIMEMASLNLRNPDATAALSLQLNDAGAAFGGFSDVVLDTRSRAMRGADENSARDVGEASQAMELISRSVRWRDKDGRDRGSNLRAIHHAGKNPKAGGRGSNQVNGDFDEITEVVADKKHKVARETITDRKGVADGQVYHYRIDLLSFPEFEATGLVAVPIDVAEYKRAKGKGSDGNDELYEAIRALRRLFAAGYRDPHVPGVKRLEHVDVAREILKGRGQRQPPETDLEAYAAFADLLNERKSALREKTRAPRADGKKQGPWHRVLMDPLTNTYSLRLTPPETLAAAIEQEAAEDLIDDEFADDGGDDD